MSYEKIQPQEPPQREEEEALHLLQETAVMDSSSSFDDPTTRTTTNRFSNLNITNHSPCSTCGCTGTAAPTSPSVSHNHKRPSSEPAFQTNPKKHNHNASATADSLFAFSKIPLPTTTAPASSSSLSPSPSPSRTPSQPTLHRTFSDPCDPNTTQLPQSPPQQKADIVACSGTPFSAAKLPPRPPTLRRTISDPTPSTANTFSSSCETGAAYECTPNARWAKRMGSCLREMTRKLDELLSTEEESGREETNNQNNGSNVENKDETMGNNSEEGFVEAVAEKIGEFLSIRLTCPCGQSYQILLAGHNCYYRVI